MLKLLQAGNQLPHTLPITNLLFLNLIWEKEAGINLSFLVLSKIQRNRKTYFWIENSEPVSPLRDNIFFLWRCFLLQFRNCAFQLLLSWSVVYFTVLTVPINLCLAETSVQLSDISSRAAREVRILAWVVSTVLLLSSLSPKAMCTFLELTMVSRSLA